MNLEKSARAFCKLHPYGPCLYPDIRTDISCDEWIWKVSSQQIWLFEKKILISWLIIQDLQMAPKNNLGRTPRSTKMEP